MGIDTDLEVATPTGVAVLAALAESFGPLPAMTVEGVGYGAGRADPAERPNVVQVIVGRTPGSGADGGPVRADDSDTEMAVVVETNVDDVTGEVLAHCISRLLDDGALDAWATPIVMKKGRPAHTISALCRPPDAALLTTLLLTETGSLGARSYPVTRHPEPRRDDEIDVGGHRVRVKVTDQRVKVEHDDAARAARALGIPLRAVLALAERPDRGPAPQAAVAPSVVTVESPDSSDVAGSPAMPAATSDSSSAIGSSPDTRQRSRPSEPTNSIVGNDVPP
jgi:hypothetical protein